MPVERKPYCFDSRLFHLFLKLNFKNICFLSLYDKDIENCPSLMSKMSMLESKSQNSDFLAKLQMDYWNMEYI